MKLGCVIALTALLGATAAGGAAATNDLFTRGLVLSHAGQFPEAAAAFADSMKAQPAAGTLVNLGLAEWQRGRAGPAILAWEQAEWIDPYDSRAAANLKFAREVAQVDAPSLKWFEAASTWLPADAWVWLTGASLWLTAGALVLPAVFRRRLAGWHRTLAALGLTVFFFSLTANIGVVSRTQIGFVLKKNAALRLTPTSGGEIITTLTAGEPARRLRTRGNYLFIRTAGASGWIEEREFRRICQPP